MTEESYPSQESLIEQIFNRMFAELEKRDEFDSSTIQNLKQLVENEEFTDVPELARTLKSNSEEAP